MHILNFQAGLSVKLKKSSKNLSLYSFLCHQMLFFYAQPLRIYWYLKHQHNHIWISVALKFDTWEDKFEDAKILNARDIRSRKSKDRHGQKKKRLKKAQTMVNKALHSNLKIEQHKPHLNRWWTQVLQKGNQFLLYQ